MATETPVLGLELPAANDFYDVEKFNSNFRKIDAGTAPSIHAANHATGGSDPITPESIGASPVGHTHNYAGSSSAGGSATSAVKLSTARTIRTNLGSTGTASFDGTSNVTPGVTGKLSVANGGTGATTAAAALKNLGITAGTDDLTAGTSALETGKIYLCYE